MVQDTMQQPAERTVTAINPRPPVVAMCPMAKMCKGVVQKQRFMLPGVVLILAGVLIFLEPRILVWLTGTASILLGSIFLMVGNLMRRFGVSRNGGE